MVRPAFTLCVVFTAAKAKNQFLDESRQHCSNQSNTEHADNKDHHALNTEAKFLAKL